MVDTGGTNSKSALALEAECNNQVDPLVVHKNTGRHGSTSALEVVESSSQGDTGACQTPLVVAYTWSQQIGPWTIDFIGLGVSSLTYKTLGRK